MVVLAVPLWEESSSRAMSRHWGSSWTRSMISYPIWRSLSIIWCCLERIVWVAILVHPSQLCFKPSSCPSNSVISSHAMSITLVLASSVLFRVRASPIWLSFITYNVTHSGSAAWMAIICCVSSAKRGVLWPQCWHLPRMLSSLGLASQWGQWNSFLLLDPLA